MQFYTVGFNSVRDASGVSPAGFVNVYDSELECDRFCEIKQNTIFKNLQISTLLAKTQQQRATKQHNTPAKFLLQQL